MVGASGAVAVIRRAETVGDLNDMEAMPAWLA